MSKYKFVLKGKDMTFTAKEKGDLNLIIPALMQYICEISIANDITKKMFLDRCKTSYETIMKLINESESE